MFGFHSTCDVFGVTLITLTRCNRFERLRSEVACRVASCDTLTGDVCVAISRDM
jgi:hypothetical protein